MKRKRSHLHFHGLNIQWISRWCRLTGLFFCLDHPANGDCLLTDILSCVKIMSSSLFHWFWTALLNSTYPYCSSFCHPYSQPSTLSIAAVHVSLFSNASPSGGRTLLFEPRRRWTLRWKTIFKYPGHFNDDTNLWRCCSVSCCDPNMKAKYPEDTV